MYHDGSLTHLAATNPTLPLCQPLQAAHSTEAEELRSSLETANTLLTKAMTAAAAAEASAAEAAETKQKELDAALVGGVEGSGGAPSTVLAACCRRVLSSIARARC